MNVFCNPKYLPQKNTTPLLLFTNKLCASPAAIWSILQSNLTSIGIDYSPNLPSAPSSFPPQEYTFPSVVFIKVWLPPQHILAILIFIIGLGIIVSSSSGVSGFLINLNY